MRALPLVLLASLSATASTLSAQLEWPRFRGPQGQGFAADAKPPTTWSATENLKWRSELPGKGTSSPVVDGDRIYPTAYTGYGVNRRDPGDPADLRRHVLAFDRSSGRELWRVTKKGTEKEDLYRGFITQHGYASSACATDGERVYAVLGKSGLFAFTRDGKELWSVPLGQKSDPAKWGDASSPVVVGDLVIVHAGILGHRLLALDKRTGEERWTMRDKALTNSWTTPVPLRDGDRQILLFAAPRRVLAIAAASGELLWEVPHPIADAVCSSIVVRGDVAYLIGSRRGAGVAFRWRGVEKGEKPEMVWERRLRAGICTPVVVGTRMFWCTGGRFYAVDAVKGGDLYSKKLPRIGARTGGFPDADYSSPIAFGDKIVQ